MPSYEELRKIFDAVDKEAKEREKRRAIAQQKEYERRKANGENFLAHREPPKKRCDHPNTMSDSTATVVWVAAMVVSLLFKGGWALCILETIIWWKFISRYW